MEAVPTDSTAHRCATLTTTRDKEGRLMKTLIFFYSLCGHIPKGIM
jgi:hypothetical protein